MTKQWKEDPCTDTFEAIPRFMVPVAVGQMGANALNRWEQMLPAGS